MKIIRVYHGDDGESHFQDIDLPTQPVANGTYERTEMRPAGETMFAIQPPGFFADWHPAPSRRFFVMVSGSAEVQVSDGEKRTLKGGDVVLFEDVDGPGHTMRVLGDEPRIGLHVSLRE
jgi:quercetin dioxygenase-like cupin family protein